MPSWRSGSILALGDRGIAVADVILVTPDEISEESFTDFIEEIEASGERLVPYAIRRR